MIQHDTTSINTTTLSAEYEVLFLRLIENLCNGGVVQINEVGTSVYFRPGALIGGADVTFDCGTERSIGYFLEPILCLAPFAKDPIALTLTGITNHNLDPSVCCLHCLHRSIASSYAIRWVWVCRSIHFVQYHCHCWVILASRISNSVYAQCTEL
jgi:hypothetical protein